MLTQTGPQCTVQCIALELIRPWYESLYWDQEQTVNIYQVTRVLSCHTIFCIISLTPTQFYFIWWYFTLKTLSQTLIKRTSILTWWDGPTQAYIITSRSQQKTIPTVHNKKWTHINSEVAIIWKVCGLLRHFPTTKFQNCKWQPKLHLAPLET